MNTRKIIITSTSIIAASLLLSAYQNNTQTDSKSLYAPLINSKWEFYAIGDSISPVVGLVTLPLIVREKFP